MPFISDLEYKKFKELVDKENAKREEEKENREVYLRGLAERVDGLLNLNSTYGPIEAYSLTFYNFIKNDFEAHKTDILFFDWQEMKRYLTEQCLKGDDIKKSFRDNLRDRGIGIRVNKKWNTVKVYKLKPKRRN